MNHKDKIITAISSMLLLSATSATFADNTMPAGTQTEKCYGISRTASNDCAAGKNSCAGSAVKDAQGDAFLLVPVGLCNRIVGGNLQPMTTDAKKS